MVVEYFLDKQPIGWHRYRMLEQMPALAESANAETGGPLIRLFNQRPGQRSSNEGYQTKNGGR